MPKSAGFSLPLTDELVKYKPVEKSAEQKELEALKNEVHTLRFRNSLKEMGVPNDLGGFIDTRIDVEQVRQFFQGFKGLDGLKDFVPNSKNIGDSGITKEEFKKMGISDRTKLYESSPELYNQLSK